MVHLVSWSLVVHSSGAETVVTGLLEEADLVVVFAETEGAGVVKNS